MPNLGVMQRTVDQYQKDLGGYQKEVRQFNFDADVYNRQLNEYQAIVDAYNNDPKVVAYDAAAKKYNAEFEAAKPSIDAYNKKVDYWNNGKLSMWVPFQGNVTQSPQQIYNSVYSIYRGSARPEYIKPYLDQVMAYHPGTAPSVPTAPSMEGLPQKPGDFTAVKPELTAEAPKDPGFTNQQMQLLSGKQSVAQQERSRDSGLVSGAQEALKQSRDEGSMIGGLLARARYST